MDLGNSGPGNPGRGGAISGEACLFDSGGTLTTSTMNQDAQRNVYGEGLACRTFGATSAYTSRDSMITSRRVRITSSYSCFSHMYKHSAPIFEVTHYEYYYRSLVCEGYVPRSTLCRYLTQLT